MIDNALSFAVVLMLGVMIARCLYVVTSWWAKVVEVHPKTLLSQISGLWEGTWSPLILVGVLE